MSRNRQRLDPGEVHVVEGQDGQNLGKGTRLVRESEAEGRLVDPVLRNRKRIVQDEESGEILLVGLDAGGKYLQAVLLGREA